MIEFVLLILAAVALFGAAITALTSRHLEPTNPAYPRWIVHSVLLSLGLLLWAVAELVGAGIPH
jgi:hypothetical protein